tara:strand:- start:315 stop:2330 length:2016 start_codon:yes stop_codon:yes gene_type:complete
MDNQAVLSNDRKSWISSTPNKLLLIAWAIEIIAALVSLFIGIFLIFGETDLGFRELLQKGALISGLLFIVLAVIELSRIPLIISIYRSSRTWWRILGSIFLIIIMFVTFESMLVGFEINTSFMTMKQKNLMNEIEANNNKISNFNTNIKDLSQLDEDSILAIYEQELETLTKLKNDKISEINSRVEEYNNDMDDRIKDINNRKLNNNDERDAQLKPLEEEKNNLVSKSNSEIQKNIINKIENLNNRLNNIENDKIKDLDRAEQLYDDGIKRLDNDYQGKDNNIKVAINSKTNEKEVDIQNLQSTIESINNSKGFGKGSQRNKAIALSNEKQNKLDNEIADLNSQLVNLSSEKINDQKAARLKYENQIKEIDKKYIKEENDIQLEIDALNNDLDERIALDQSSVKEDLLLVNNEISEIRSQFEEKNKKDDIEQNEIIELYSNEKSKLNSQIEVINGNFDKDKALLDENRKNKIDDLDSQKNKIDSLIDKKSIIIDENTIIKNEYNDLATTSILHQFALKIPVWLYPSCGVVTDNGDILPSQTPADITPDCLDFTETIWFGSLALVISITGTAVALGSEVLRSPIQKNKRSSTTGLFLKIIYYLRKPRIKKEIEIKKEKEIETIVKEVIKEVAVEKIVPTEILVPKIQKEIVHIPVYTNDESLLNISKKDKKK